MKLDYVCAGSMRALFKCAAFKLAFSIPCTVLYSYDRFH